MFRKFLLLAVLIVLALGVSSPPANGYAIRTTCYDLQGTAADGTYVYSGMAAHNFLAPGTRVTLTGSGVRAFFGRHRFTVHDTGPALSDGHMDLWSPGGCASWGVRTVQLHLGWPRKRAKFHGGHAQRPYAPWMR